MVKESVRKCSHCGHNGHNSRTCNGNGKGCLKLFGVTILTQKEDESIRKSKSTGNLIACIGEHSVLDVGYLSDGLIHSKRANDAHERKKGVPWTEDEHRAFLAGLEKLGKGDWRGVSRIYVPSRTPTQVASHAQKYFIRMSTADKKKRRSSLFDMSFNEPQIYHSPSQEPLDKTAEISPQADKLPAANLNNIGDTEGQVSASTSALVASPLEAPPVLPLAASYGVPDFRQMPYMPMVGVSGNVQNFPGGTLYPTMSLVPMVNFPNHHGYFYVPKSYGNFATCGPYMAQPSSGLLAQPLTHGLLSQAGSAETSSMVNKDGLDMHVGVN
ncbi:hypothetical protein HYC85_000989 [Camellia sinensis]|uniref:Uncharacterized protein n=1 Tax=Camellia sinensis TaxID=4442 RepID=A0A7J7I447_CAMSI|nr:hypothetical protein HYC85_000989 [Camellia sinensis]